MCEYQCPTKIGNITFTDSTTPDYGFELQLLKSGLDIFRKRKNRIAEFRKIPNTAKLVENPYLYSVLITHDRTHGRSEKWFIYFGCPLCKNFGLQSLSI